MSTRFQIAALLFLIVQSVAFGAALLIVVQSPLPERTIITLLPWIAA